MDLEMGFLQLASGSKSDRPTTEPSPDQSNTSNPSHCTDKRQRECVLFFEKNEATGLVTVRFSCALNNPAIGQLAEEESKAENDNLKLRKKCVAEWKFHETGRTSLSFTYEDPIEGRALSIQNEYDKWNFVHPTETKTWMSAECTYDPKKAIQVGSIGGEGEEDYGGNGKSTIGGEGEDDGGNGNCFESSMIFVADEVLGWLPLKSRYYSTRAFVPDTELEDETRDLLLRELDGKRDNAHELCRDLFRPLHGFDENWKIRKLEGAEDLQKVRVVEIGPYHHHHQDKDELFVTTKMKWQIVTYLEKICGFDWKSYFSLIRRDGDKLLSLYGNKFEMDKNYFIEMLFLDGCFLFFVFMILGSYDLRSKLLKADIMPCSFLEGFLKQRFVEFTTDIVSRAEEIKLDLLMYNNQIPFNVIECVPCENLKSFIGCSMEKLALQSFDDIYPPVNPQCRKTEHSKELHHVLHLFHWSRIPSSTWYNRPVISSLAGAIPSASELQRSGVSFHNKPLGSSLDVTFSHGLWGAFKLKGVLNIPNIYITDYTKYILHTLVIFEQRHPVIHFNGTLSESGFSATSYLASIMQLIQSEKDVKLFRRSGILANMSKTDKEVLETIQGLDLNLLSVSTQPTLNINLAKETYDLFTKIRDHHGWKWSIWYGEFMQNYCANTWITLSVVAGILLFFFTGLQAAYSVASYHFPKK